MAHTAHKNPEEVEEKEDSELEFQQKAKAVVQLIKQSKHFIIFTGAGISTSAGIPDLRGPNGIWTLKAQGKPTPAREIAIKALPTPTHMSIVELVKHGVVKYLISQNTDGLHRKSGVALDKFAELHGNQTLEKCHTPGCNKEYIRDYRTRNAVETHDHITGRKCGKCGGDLHDSIINFGENLPDKELSCGYEQAEKADLCLALGSSLTVNPAASIPKIVAKRGNLVICNKQDTPLDNLAKYRIYASTDKLMQFIMQELNMQIPKWLLRRFITVSCEIKDNLTTVRIASIDSDGLEASIVKQCRIMVPFNFQNASAQIHSEPFVFDNINKLFDVEKITPEEMMKWKNRKILLLLNKANVNTSNVFEKSDLVKLFLNNVNKLRKEATVELTFMGHYLEPLYTFDLDLNNECSVVLILDYDATTREWTLVEKKAS